MGLNDTLWDRVSKMLAAKQLRCKDLRRLMKEAGIKRDKNTFTNWCLGRPILIESDEKGRPTLKRGPRPEIRIKDLEDLAVALGVSPAELVTPIDQEAEAPAQLKLPFEQSGVARIELECTGDAVIIRPSPKSPVSRPKRRLAR